MTHSEATKDKIPVKAKGGVVVFEGIPEGTFTLKQHLGGETADAKPPITFLEALVCLEQLTSLCKYLASDRDPLNKSRLLWDPTQLLKPENILMFPKPSSSGGCCSRFIPKCLSIKVVPASNFQESNYLLILAELCCQCLFAYSLGDFMAADPEATMPFRKVFGNTPDLEAWSGNTTTSLKRLIIKCSGALSKQEQWQGLTAFHKELQRIVHTGLVDFETFCEPAAATQTIPAQFDGVANHRDPDREAQNVASPGWDSVCE